MTGLFGTEEDVDKPGLFTDKDKHRSHEQLLRATNEMNMIKYRSNEHMVVERGEATRTREGRRCPIHASLARRTAIRP
jgi:hypothetical protein